MCKSNNNSDPVMMRNAESSIEQIQNYISLIGKGCYTFILFYVCVLFFLKEQPGKMLLWQLWHRYALTELLAGYV